MRTRSPGVGWFQWIVTLRFRILGSVGVSVDGAPVVVGAARQRALLARLLLDANRSLHPRCAHRRHLGRRDSAASRRRAADRRLAASDARSARLADRLTSDPGGYRHRGRRRRARSPARAAHVLPCAGALAAERLRGGADARPTPRCAVGPATRSPIFGDAPFYDSAHAELRELRLAIYELRNRAYLAVRASRRGPRRHRGLDQRRPVA